MFCKKCIPVQCYGLLKECSYILPFKYTQKPYTTLVKNGRQVQQIPLYTYSTVWATNTKEENQHK